MEKIFFYCHCNFAITLQLKEMRKNNNAKSFDDVAIMILIENMIEKEKKFTDEDLMQFNFFFRSKVSRLS